MTRKPEPLPEGRLLKTALARAGMSARQAAKKAGITEARWRQIVNGYQTPARGLHVPVRGPASTVAAMARAVGLTPQQLRDAGRDDAAEALDELLLGAPTTPEDPTPWHGDLNGPTDLLHEGERLRWRPHDGGRLYELTVEGIVFEAALETQDLSEAVPELRRTLMKRISRLNVLMVDRMHP